MNESRDSLKRIDHDGLAIFYTPLQKDPSPSSQRLPPILFMPYPHALHTSTSPSVVSLLNHLANPGSEGGNNSSDASKTRPHRIAFTFDPPNCGLSSRPMKLTMEEMLSCSKEAFNSLKSEMGQENNEIDLVGHSQSALAALALSLDPSLLKIRRMLLIGPAGPSGKTYMNASGALWNSSHPGFLGMAWKGMLAKYLWPSKATANDLFNYIESYSFHDPSKIPKRREISWGDYLIRHENPRGVAWSSVALQLDYSNQLDQVSAEKVLVCNGRYDPQTPLECAEAIVKGIGKNKADLTVFEESGHAPFIEEPERFWQVVDAFLND